MLFWNVYIKKGVFLMRKNQQSGSTMVEMLGVLGIIAMVTVSLFGIIGKVFDRYKQAEIVDEIRTLQKNIKNRFSADADFSKLSQTGIEQKLIKERVIPPYMVVNNDIVHAYGAKVSISGNKNSYSIKFLKLTKQGCVELLMQNWAVSDMSDLIQIKVGGKTYTWNGATKLPVKIHDAMDLCKDETSENNIEWTFQ